MVALTNSLDSRVSGSPLAALTSELHRAYSGGYRSRVGRRIVGVGAKGYKSHGD